MWSYANQETQIAAAAPWNVFNRRTPHPVLLKPTLSTQLCDAVDRSGLAIAMKRRLQSTAFRVRILCVWLVVALLIAVTQYSLQPRSFLQHLWIELLTLFFAFVVFVAALH